MRAVIVTPGAARISTRPQPFSPTAAPPLPAAATYSCSCSRARGNAVCRAVPYSTEEPGGDSAELYERLGVAPGASTDAVKRAYRRLALRLHPDVNKEPGAEHHFRAIQEAYWSLTHAGAIKDNQDLSFWRPRWQQQVNDLKARAETGGKDGPRFRARNDIPESAAMSRSPAVAPEHVGVGAWGAPRGGGGAVEETEGRWGRAAEGGIAATSGVTDEAPWAVEDDGDDENGPLATDHEEVRSQLGGLKARSNRRRRKVPTPAEIAAALAKAPRDIEPVRQFYAQVDIT